MIKRLPVLYVTEQNIFNWVETEKPSGKAISDVAESKRQGNAYLQMKSFVASCIVQISSDNQVITDPAKISRMCSLMSNKNLEYLSQEIMVDYYNGEDYVEGFYKCPMCGTPKVCAKKMLDGVEIDTRDRISDLEVVFMEDPEELSFSIELTEGVLIENKSYKVLVQSIRMTMPTTEHHIQAINAVGETNNALLQYHIYAKALTHVNGEPVDNDWRNKCGVMLFNNCREVHKDLGAISDYINKYGIQPKILKRCAGPDCGHEWKVYLESANYFGSVLR